MDAFEIGQIDDVIHSRVRLGIMAYLMAADVADFNTLKAKLETTDGTVSVHMRKLEDAGYVTIEKTFKGRRPLTRIHLTTTGRKAFRTYLDVIGKLHSETIRILALPDVRTKLDNITVARITNTPAEFAAIIKAETPYWAKVIKEAGAKLTE